MRVRNGVGGSLSDGARKVETGREDEKADTERMWKLVGDQGEFSRVHVRRSVDLLFDGSGLR
jgi:hypothetical protein